MVTITEEILEKTAALANLEMTEQMKQKMAKELEEMVHFMDRLQEVDTDAVEPMATIHDVSNVFREDEVLQGERESLLSNAPKLREDMIVVPKSFE